MSQGFQQIKQHITNRNEIFLTKARLADPVINKHAVSPVGEVHMIRDNSLRHGWRAEPGRTVRQLEEIVWYGGEEFILDLGTHCVGYLEISAETVGSPQDAPVHMKYIFGEITAEVAEDFSAYQGWLSSSWLQQEDKYYDVMPEKIVLERRYCCRYIKVRIIATSRKFGVRLSNVQFISVTSAAGKNPGKIFSDPLLQKIDDISVLTLKNCMQSVFEDGPKRDRRLWLGDLRLQALVNYATFQHNDLVKRCLYLFAGVTRNDGMVSANLFMQPEVQADDTYLLDYSLFFVATLADYFQQTNDKESARELWPTAKQQIDLAVNRLDAQGVFSDSEEWWAFIDWHESLNKQAAAQGVFIYCVSKAITLAKAVAPESLHYLYALKERLVKGVMTSLWDEQSGFFTSGKFKQVSWASQVWLILADVGDVSFQRELLDRLHSTSPQIHMKTPYMMHHYVEALLKCGKRDEAVNVIKSYWGAMADFGADTFWEVFDPADASLSPYGSPVINSYCHAWSCTPSWLLRK